MPRQRIHVQIDGLLSVHAVRAVWTALTGVPGVLQAEVTMRGVVLETDGPIDRGLLADSLALAGVQLLDMTVEKGHLPLL
jgi:hypothetical protein